MAETDARTEADGTEPRSTLEREEDRAKIRRNQRKKGLLIVHTGLGKGKTTAALGLLLRAWGRGMKVGGIQFFKHEKARFGEIRAAARMGIELIPMGDGFTWTSRDLDETQAKALHGWEVAKEKIVHGGYDLFLLDEFTYVMHYAWIDAGEALDWLRQNKPADLHLIITGRHAPAVLLDQADLVTEMQLVKHPFRDQGIRAQPGIEF
jgi:cob(I)alamin adenosyltransferase